VQEHPTSDVTDAANQIVVTIGVFAGDRNGCARVTGNSNGADVFVSDQPTTAGYSSTEQSWD
jgi:hypothetical protein